MKHRHFIAGIVVAVGAVAATAVLAQQGAMDAAGMGRGMGPRMSFEELDTNGDGQISKEEMQARVQGRFNALDADGNGTISLEEMQAQARQRADERAAWMFKQMDENGDGALSADEMKGPRRSDGMMNRMFSRMDQDQSGTISKEEFDNAQARMRKFDHKRMGDPDGKHMHQRQWMMDGNCDGPGRGAGKAPMQGNN
ncbi:EF-hand domain-containing protein [Pseudodonghicola xiamenensis]|nr:EF-hand domain-containing protein [Pseudodonghicola xiamenensis]